MSAPTANRHISGRLSHTAGTSPHTGGIPRQQVTSFDDLLSQVPIAQLADKLGVDQLMATNAVKAALPTLLGGLPANATEPVGALIGALDQHGELIEGEGAADVDKVDIASGSKIVDKVFGAKQNAVISALGATAGTVGNDLVA
ncbi:DUF937 domain-containing protein [Nocardia sp. NPDC004604]|uniref:DUF937 domain-containing protein n=1 Tax=Nocardia sp. NPDC004604 TaxID=3157013 RepID=UPI0033A681A8